MHYTQYRGLAQVANWVKLKFAAMNLKKLAQWRWKDLRSSLCFAVFPFIYARKPISVSTSSMRVAQECKCA